MCLLLLVRTGNRQSRSRSGKPWGNFRSLKSRLTKTKLCTARASLSLVRWKSDWAIRCSVKVGVLKTPTFVHLVGRRRPSLNKEVIKSGLHGVWFRPFTLRFHFGNSLYCLNVIGFKIYFLRKSFTASLQCSCNILRDCSGIQWDICMGPNWLFWLLSPLVLANHNARDSNQDFFFFFKPRS